MTDAASWNQNIFVPHNDTCVCVQTRIKANRMYNFFPFPIHYKNLNIF